MTFEQIEAAYKKAHDCWRTEDCADTLFEEIRKRATGEIYTNGETCESRFQDIIHICDIYLKGINDENTDN